MYKFLLCRYHNIFYSTTLSFVNFIDLNILVSNLKESRSRLKFFCNFSHSIYNFIFNHQSRLLTPDTNLSSIYTSHDCTIYSFYKLHTHTIYIFIFWKSSRCISHSYMVLASERACHFDVVRNLMHPQTGCRSLLHR